jgi:hypothetical protein
LASYSLYLSRCGTYKVNEKRNFIGHLVEELACTDAKVAATDLEIRSNDQKVAVNLVVGGFS